VAEDSERSSNSLHYIHEVARQDNNHSGREPYLSTSDDGLGTHEVPIYNTHSCRRPAEDKSRSSESPDSTVVVFGF